MAYEYINKIIISVEMQRLILFGLPIVAAYFADYNGFDACGYNHWTCEYHDKKYELIYTCPTWETNTRVWIWTARLPAGTTALTVKDCNRVEVHMDCSTGKRPYSIKRFKVIDVGFLEFLPLTNPTEVLHDNAKIYLAPPEIHIENVSHAKFQPGMFEAIREPCRGEYSGISNLTLVNTHIEKLQQNLFGHRYLEKILFDKVVIDGSVDADSLNLGVKELTVTRSTFPDLPNRGIQIRGLNNVKISSSKFGKIKNGGLRISSKNIYFFENEVEDIGSEGLDLFGSYIQIYRNTFQHLESGALEKISFSYGFLVNEYAFKLIYNFTENTMKSLNPGSFHLNWTSYQSTCANIIFKKNSFDCSCTNLGWISLLHGLGPKIMKSKEFYDVYLNTNDNYCTGYRHCPFRGILEKMPDICNNKTSLVEMCNKTDDPTTESHEGTTIQSPTTLAISKIKKMKEQLALDYAEPYQETVPLMSYSENKMNSRNYEKPAIWAVISMLALCISFGMFIWCHRRRKPMKIVMTKLTNQNTSDAGTIIVLNEHSNELYNRT